MRLFVALRLEDTVKQEIIRIQDNLNQSECDIKWVNADSIHLTLKFLGEVQEEKITNIVKSIEYVSHNNSPFIMSICGLGVFSNIKSPRVIWIGINNGQEELINLSKSLEIKLPCKKEKRDFNPHITIGRVKSNKNLSHLMDKINNICVCELTQKINKVFLIQSTLTSKGPVYTDVKEFNLSVV